MSLLATYLYRWDMDEMTNRIGDSVVESRGRTVGACCER